jgi:signal transduction histidine kinase
MPIMDGFELCRRLRKNSQTAQLPVILLTARRDVGRVLEGFEAGADDYVTKPFQARELLARVSVHVRLRRMVSEMAHRERLASLGVLAASLAHQVRNPLAAILSGLPAVRKRLERIHTLVNDLMDLSRVDQENVARLRPAQGVRACVRLIEARLQGSVQIEADLDDTLELEGRPGDLSHVFLNLIDNAVRAAGDGGRVFLRVVRRGELALFESEDSGPGIPPEAQEAVFAPFYTTRRPGEGTGLGLAIARQVVLQHGGTISVGRSALGGALLTVSLPLATVVAAASADRISITVH